MPDIAVSGVFVAAKLVVSILLSPLAVYRLVVLVRDDEGPFSICHNVREKFQQNTWVGRGLRCPSCLSFWFGPVVALLLHLRWGQTLITGLGLSGLVVMFYRKGWF